MKYPKVIQDAVYWLREAGRPGIAEALEAEYNQVRERVKRLEVGHDEWRTIAHRLRSQLSGSGVAARIDALTKFFWLCWDGARGVALPSVDDLDGGDIQEWGVKCGLLTKVVAAAPCGEGCVCEEYVGDDFPTDCYRPTVPRAVSAGGGTEPE